MPTQTLSALYDRYDDAAAAVTKLEAAGVPHSDISLVSNKAETSTSGTGETADHAATGAGTGATLGTILGGGAGLLAGLGLMAIPGVGPVVAAGWLVATLTGAGIGAAAVRADEAHAGVATRILEEHGAVDLDARAQGWESEGWSNETAGEARGDTSTLIGSDAAAGTLARENDAVSAPMTGTDTRTSGARRVRVYNHPV